MGDKTAIEWTDATWNPVTGCTKVSRGCDNCYAERLAERFRGTPGHPFEKGFDLTLREERLRQPLSWKRPRRIFVNSMSDLFHKEIPTGFIDRVFDVMEAANRHVYQVLTKRSSLMKNYLWSRYGGRSAPRHIWCGVSVEDRGATVRIAHLKETPVPVRFVSMEPLLGPMGDIDLEGISWIIVGGESGPKARPMNLRWVLDIRDSCEREGVDFFFKQWGGPTPKSRGRRLEGVEHNAAPLVRGRKNPMQFRNPPQFRWSPDGRPPKIEAHSRAKLTVLRSYLGAYFDRLNVNPNREEFKIDLVDGFSGGGTFRDSDETVSGTPLIMIEELEKAKERLNTNRAKPLSVDCKFYFTDAEQAHTEHLRNVLMERGYDTDSNDNIVVRNGRFENEIEDIIAEIQRRQPRAGRAIFLLDQTGFSHVCLKMVARILGELPAAEVIMTFAADALINHLAETPALVQAVEPLELTEDQLRDMIQRKNAYGRAFAQRYLRDQIRGATNAPFDTPFFIRPKQSRRALWFLHLSRHPVARDVMIQCHWKVQNTFEHYGHGDFRMLGWDALKSGTLPRFNFEEEENRNLRNQLLKSMPDKLSALASQHPVTVDSVRREFANQTAAPFSVMDEVILDLFRSREFEVLSPGGKVRSHSLIRLQPTDRIARSSSPLLPGLLRRSPRRRRR